MARDTYSDLNEERPEDWRPDTDRVRGVARDEDEEEFEDAEEFDEEDIDGEGEGTS